jgi:hypothetical protein
MGRHSSSENGLLGIKEVEQAGFQRAALVSAFDDPQ